MLFYSFCLFILREHIRREGCELVFYTIGGEDCHIRAEVHYPCQKHGAHKHFYAHVKYVSVIFENAVSKPNLSIMTLASWFSQRSVTVSSRPPYIPKVCFE